MKKYVAIIVFSSLGLSLSGAPICAINQELNKDTANQLNEFRQQTIETCLACANNSCKLKPWPEEKKGDAAVCKLLFCTPSYVSKFFEKPDNVKPGKTRIKFSYSINPKGKIKDIEVSSAKGAMNAREKMIGQSIGYRYDVNLLPDYSKLTPFLKKYIEAMLWWRYHSKKETAGETEGR